MAQSCRALWIRRTSNGGFDLKFENIYFFPVSCLRNLRSLSLRYGSHIFTKVGHLICGTNFDFRTPIEGRPF